MCLILFGYRCDPDVPLLVAANRDEFHQREASVANYWEDDPSVIAGRDLVAGGTWLGCTTGGRFAALTNFSSLEDPPPPRSRGILVQEFLSGSQSAKHYAHSIKGPDFAGFNLLLFDGEDLVYTSNKSATEVLQPGYYGLSNAELGARWPKCEQGAAALQEAADAQVDDGALIDLLRSAAIPDDNLLPRRGRPLEFERRVAPCFILGDEYGTRASTVVRIKHADVSLTEQTYFAAGETGGRVNYQSPMTDH
ncbi:MAG: NRDE family protein [Pseudomonadota bacterium]